MSVALPDDVAVLDAVDDPGAFVVAALDRAKAWLAQATTTDLPEVVENKRRAEAIRCYVAQKELAHDAELAATELVRRAERRIGQLIREGQENGEIKRQGERGPEKAADDTRSFSAKPGPTDFAPAHELSSNGTGIYQMTDGVSDDDFEEALDEARQEKNMSRANVVRKVKAKNDPESRLMERNRAHRLTQITALAATGRTSHQIAEQIGVSAEYVRRLAGEEGVQLADAVVGRQRRHDSNRIVAETVATLDGVATGLRLVEPTDLDSNQVSAWLASLDDSMKELSKLRKTLRGMTK